MNEELRVTGLVLGGQAYKEKDKLLTIFTVEIGKITASIRGVKLPKAKLKIFAQPFCLAEFILSKNGQFYTIISANLIDDFMGITQDMDNYCVGNMLLEIDNLIVKPAMVSQPLFLTTIKALRAIVYDNIDAKLVAIKYLLSIMKISGGGWQFETCSNCGSKYISDVYLDLLNGSLCCRNCASYESVALSKAEFNGLKIVDNCDISNLKTLKLNAGLVSSCLTLLVNNFQVQNEYKIKSLF